MSDAPAEDSQRLLDAFARPAWVVMMVGQMLLGLALFLSLILKYYMLVFGSEVCSADSETLGNLIRCTSTLEITAHTVLGVAGLRVAACFFADEPRALLQPSMIGVIGVLLLYLSGLSSAEASWPAAALLLALVISLSVLFAGLYLKTFKS